MVLESQQRQELLANSSQSTQVLLTENATLSFDMVSLYTRHEFKNIYDSDMAKGDSAWYMDQVLCSMLLTDYRNAHKNYTLSERGRASRLDRANGISYWNREKFDQFGDAHLIHDTILQEANWKVFNRLLNALFNQTIVNLFNDYYRQYMIGNSKPTSG